MSEHLCFSLNLLIGCPYGIKAITAAFLRFEKCDTSILSFEFVKGFSVYFVSSVCVKCG